MAEAKKIVVKAALDCEKCKKRVLKTAVQVEGVDSVSVDKDSKLTVIGNADPVCLVSALRKFGCAELISVGLAKEPEKPKPKPEDKNKEVPRKKECQKDQCNKEEVKCQKDQCHKDEVKKKECQKDQCHKDEVKKEAAACCRPAEYIIVMPPQCHCFRDENPNSCSIS